MNENKEPTTAPVPEDMVSGNALAVISREEINMQISTAKRYPRTMSTVKSTMMSLATLDQETAAACFYSLPRGGKVIQGPSVRLAEIAVSSYGNLRVATRVVGVFPNDKDQPHVEVQSVCHDLQTNVAVSMEKRRRITGKKSKGGRIDEDDINLAVNACSAIAFRDAVFKVIPLALIKPVFESAKRVAIGDAKTLATRRASAIEAFGKMGVARDLILLKLERRSIEDINLEDLETLIGLFNAIKDGESSIEECFPAPAPVAEKKAEPEAPKAKTPESPTAPQPETSPAPTAAQAAPPTPPEPEAPKLTDKQLLQDFVETAGFNFAIFAKWAVGEGVIADADSLASFDDVKEADAKRLLRSKHGMERGLAKYKDQDAK